MRPIAHVSFPVRDLREAIEFYGSTLGATIGRRTESFADVLLFATQLTIHHDPANVTTPMPRTRHFGWTLPWSDWEVLAERIGGADSIVAGPTISYVGEPTEQGKVMLVDPSGNLIELKAYRHPEHVLGGIAVSDEPG